MFLRSTNISILSIILLGGKEALSFQVAPIGAATKSSLFRPINNNRDPSPFSSLRHTGATHHRATHSPVIEDVVKDNRGGEGGDSEDGVGAWIPLATKSGLFSLGPQRIRVMGVDLVVWHTPFDKKSMKGKGKKAKKENQVTWTAQIDACTHRLAPLSQGRVDPESQCIECP